MRRKRVQKYDSSKQIIESHACKKEIFLEDCPSVVTLPPFISGGENLSELLFLFCYASRARREDVVGAFIIEFALMEDETTYTRTFFSLISKRGLFFHRCAKT